MRIRGPSLVALLGFSILGIAYLGGEASAQRGKSAPACGAKILPLVVGNQWTYNPIPAPAPLPANLARIAPEQPKEIVVTVTAVDTKGRETTVTLEEKLSYDISKDSSKPVIVAHTVTSTIVCTPRGKFDISPESFFFAGEPGGFHGLTFESFERKKETSIKLVNGTIGEDEWIEEITSTFTRTASKDSGAKHSGGKLELERKVTPQEPEDVATKMMIYRAEKLGIETTGRVTLDDRRAPNGKPCTRTEVQKDPKDPTKNINVKIDMVACELPANWISQIWLAPNVGVVQTLNSFAHMYQLVDVQLK